MAKKSKLLSARAVATAKPGQTLNDGDGLTLRVGRGGKRSWVLRYWQGGKAGNIGLGSYPDVGLAEARALAADRRGQIAAGEKPTGARQARTAPALPETDRGPTFAEIAQRVIDRNRGAWSANNLKSWEQTVRVHLNPSLGDIPVADVTKANILDAISPIWATKPASAKRARQYCFSILQFATDYGLRDHNPTPPSKSYAWPKQDHKTIHMAACHWSEIGRVLAQFQDGTSDRITKLAFEFLILTAVRKNEVLGATWTEITGDVWSIPAARMKRRIGHDVPLTPRCLAILREAAEITGADDGLIFPSRHGRKISDNCLNMAMQRLNLRITAHGFRSTFRDWAAECTATPFGVVERALAHTVGDTTTESYLRSNLLNQRRDLMGEWADFVANQQKDD